MIALLAWWDRVTKRWGNDLTAYLIRRHPRWFR